MTYGIISEFNPFHNGHKFLIDKIKKNNDTVVSVTSSTFVQRGDISIINKTDKTKASLKNGVDIVIELPAVYSLGSAEVFSKSAVEILKATGITDCLAFGSECGNIEKLKSCVDALNNTEVQRRIKENMREGEYYPKAVFNSVTEIYGEETGNIFSGSNNILGIEYINALKNSGISPVTFKRTGAQHDSNITRGSIASGSYIRNNYSQKEIFIPNYHITDSARIENIEKIIIYKFLTMDKDMIAELPDVNEGFENRIKEYAKSNISLSELCNSLKTKRYTMARIRRILCCGLLGISNKIQQCPVPYIRILGFTDKGRKRLGEIKEKATLPVITNVKEGYDKLNQTGKIIMDIEILATKIWSLASNNHTIMKNDFQQQLVRA